MVNSLLCVKPSVPSTTYLKRWSNQQESLKQKMTLIRYGTPKTLKGITIRMRLNSSGSSRGSNNGSNHKIDTGLVCNLPNRNSCYYVTKSS
jgi:hypothetical protein